MKNTYNIFQKFFSIILLINFLLFFKQLNAQDGEIVVEEKSRIKIDTLLEMKIDQTINPATLSHLNEVLKMAKAKKNTGILIQINTPGGLVSVTKAMISAIGESKIPFIALVGPEGASATSAGAILSAASHFLLMSAGTNIGAATPITMQSDLPKDSRSKAINDLVALVTSLRQARGKSTTHFGTMASEANSYSANDALNLGIADAIISNPEEISEQLNGKEIILEGQKFVLEIENLKIELIEMDLGQQVLNFLASPELAYILFLFGAALIYFELQAPGGFIAGGIGAICLLIAGISFQVIPLNMGGFGLILLSFVLFILEIYITSFGLLSIAAIAALVAGSLFLFRTNDAYFELSKVVIFSIMTAIVSFLGIVMTIFLKNQKQLSRNFNDEIPNEATVINFLETRNGQFYYQIKIRGAIWNAYSTHHFKIGQIVAIEEKDRNNMSYIIRPINK